MARQNVYMSQKIYDALKSIVEERQAQGASFSDANMSSVSSEMLDIGIRVTMNLKKKENEEGLSPDDLYRKMMMEDMIISRGCIQKIFQMLFDMQEIKADSRYDFRDAIQTIKDERDKCVGSFFPES